MTIESWKTEYKRWKSLTPLQIRLLEDEPKSLSQVWLLNSMWCDWKDIKKIKDTELPRIRENELEDPWLDCK